LLAKYSLNDSVVIHNLDLIKYDGIKESKVQLADMQELVDTIEIHFNIPREISAESVSQLGEFGDAWN